MKRSIMNNKIFIRLIFCLALIMPGCSKDVRVSPELRQGEQGSVLGKAGGAAQQSAVSVGAKQISGIGFFDETDECNALSQGAELCPQNDWGYCRLSLRIRRRIQMFAERDLL